MEEEYHGISHTHVVKQSENQELFHPDSDPRLLHESCPACAALMKDWWTFIRRMKEDAS